MDTELACTANFQIMNLSHESSAFHVQASASYMVLSRPCAALSFQRGRGENYQKRLASRVHNLLCS